MQHELTLERLAQCGQIRIGFQRHTPPFSYSKEVAFDPVGYSVDLAQAVVKRLASACQSELLIVPVETTSSTREAMLMAGEFDIECGSTTITEFRLQRVAFSRPIFRTSHRLALREGIAMGPDRMLHITGITGSTSHATLINEASPDLHFEFRGLPSIGEAFEAYCFDHNIDGLIADELILASLLNRVDGTATTVHDKRMGSEEYGFMLRQADRELLVEVNNALEQVLGSPSFLQTLSRWIGPSCPSTGGDPSANT